MPLLVACSSNSNAASSKAKSCADKANETAEKYLSYEIDYKETKEIIDELKDDMGYVDDLSHDASNYYPDFYISLYLANLSHDLYFDDLYGTDETYSKIQEDIQSLKNASK
jgi:hypothetical protein